MRVVPARGLEHHSVALAALGTTFSTRQGFLYRCTGLTTRTHATINTNAPVIATHSALSQGSLT